MDNIRFKHGAEPQLKRKDYAVKATVLEDGEFECIGNATGYLDSYGDVTMPGSFRKRAKRFVERGKLFYGHNYGHPPIGRPLEAKETEEGLYVKGKINGTRLGKDVLETMRGGEIDRFSIGYNVPEGGSISFDSVKSFRKYCEEQGVADKIDWDSMKGYAGRVNALLEVDVMELSAVPWPANDRSVLTQVKDEPISGDDDALPAGASLAEHSEAVLAAVKGLVVRARAVQDMRAKDGRSLGGERIEQFKELAAEIEALVAACSEKANPMRRLEMELLALSGALA